MTAVATFADMLERQAGLGEKIAFADESRTTSFASFRERVVKLADSLVRAGLCPGDRIAILSRNRAEAVECIAVCAAGFIPVPLNWRLSPPELVRILEDCKPAAIFCDFQGAEVASASDLPVYGAGLRISFDDCEGWLDYQVLLQEGSSSSKLPSITPSDTALIVYTSGTTGSPKGAMITHGCVVANGVTSATEALGVDERDTILCVMPLFHVGGLCYYLLPSYMAGATTYLRPAFDAGDALKSVSALGITNIHVVPTMLADILSHPLAERAQSLKRIVYAGSSMPLTLLGRAMTVLPDCEFSQSYGSTEGGIVTSLSPHDHRIAAANNGSILRSCGRPLVGTDVKLVVGDGRPCLPGEAGEVLVRSNRTMAGYWNLPTKTAEVFSGSHIRTGDVGYLDEEGYLYLIDRKNDMIVTGGENVFPSEVEAALYRYEDVSEVSVFGMPDPRWVERVVAAVVLRPGSVVTPEELIRFAKSSLASYKCPKTVVFMNSLPRNGVGKVSRRELRSQLEAKQKLAESESSF